MRDRGNVVGPCRRRVACNRCGFLFERRHAQGREVRQGRGAAPLLHSAQCGTAEDSFFQHRSGRPGNRLREMAPAIGLYVWMLSRGHIRGYNAQRLEGVVNGTFREERYSAWGCSSTSLSPPFRLKHGQFNLLQVPRPSALMPQCHSALAFRFAPTVG
jgi:hypothetical protein